MLISYIIVSPLYIRCVICCSPYEFIKQIILRQLTVPEESPIELPAILVEIELEKPLIHFLMNSLYCTTTFSCYYMYPWQNLSHHLMLLPFRFPVRFMTEQLSQPDKICSSVSHNFSSGTHSLFCIWFYGDIFSRPLNTLYYTDLQLIISLFICIFLQVFVPLQYKTCRNIC